MLALFCQISDRLDECKHLESSWISALNMCKVATEVAITSGEHLYTIGEHGWLICKAQLVLSLVLGFKYIEKWKYNHT